jgi:TonB family protein
VFTQLIASRPAQVRERPGLVLSTLLHGSVVAAAVLLTAQPPHEAGVQEPRVELIHFPRPTPEPQPIARPRAPVPAPSPSVPVIATIAPPIVAPTTISTELPVPGITPWTAPLPGGATGAPGGSIEGAGTGDPLPGPSGAYAEEHVDVPVALERRSPLPRYPEALRSWRTEGVARLTFVVDTLGRVEMGTVNVIESSHPAFAASVRATLPRMRFRPARIGERPVRQLVEFPITFRLEP